jgi:hypothetical protein
MSYMGSMYFGLVAGREAVPGVDAISRHIVDALEELKKPADRAMAAVNRPARAPRRPAGERGSRRRSADRS